MEEGSDDDEYCDDENSSNGLFVDPVAVVVAAVAVVATEDWDVDEEPDIEEVVGSTLRKSIQGVLIGSSSMC